MSMEFSEIASCQGALSNWAGKAHYGLEMSQEQNEISEVMDAWARKLGQTGKDPHGELAQLIQKAVTIDEVGAPSELIGRMFVEGTIDEFDDVKFVKEPKNTIVAHEAISGGNVDRSFIEHTLVSPTWKSLQAETDITMQDLRRNGYRSVAKLVTFIKDAFEVKKVAMILSAVDAMITNTMPNYIGESTSLPTATSADKLALYLADVTDGGRPLAFALNKYIQAMSKLAQAERWPTDKDKSLYNETGFLNLYAGMELLGFSGVKKTGDGGLIVPTNRVFGIGGTIGACNTRGESRTLQKEDINNETVHIKVTGYTFGYAIDDISKVAKIVIA